MSKDLAQRIYTAALGIPLLVIVFYWGGMYLLITLGLISVLGNWEYNSILLKNGIVNSIIDIFLVLAIFTITALPELLNLTTLGYIFSITALICFKLFIMSIFKLGKLTAKDYMLTIFGWIYTGFFVGLIYRLESENGQQHIVLLLLALIWITDSAAYFIGMRYGTHRGIFPVSPRKSAEGFLAGLIAPVLLVILFSFIIDLFDLNLLLLTAISAGLFGQLGDLLESKIKRTAGVKDSSNIIPGHGGVLDRFDSLLVAAPILYLMKRLFT